MQRILFVSDGRSGLSLLAKSMAEEVAGDRYVIGCVVTDTEKPDPAVFEILDYLNLESTASCRKLFAVRDLSGSDMVISFDREHEEVWGSLPGTATILHWDVGLDTGTAASPAARLEQYHDVRRVIRHHITELFREQCLTVYIRSQQKWLRYFESIDIGIVVHDRNRIITYFNRHAEEVMKYSRDEVLGQDCHELFSWRLCGEKCAFCDQNEDVKDTLWYTRDIQRKDGKLRHVEINLLPLRGDQGESLGAMVSFRDFTHRMHVEKKFDEIKHYMGIVGQTPGMMQVFDSIRDVGPTDVTTLIQGESGTGKELVAEALYKISGRSSRPFVVVNCGALPEGLLETELFGHVRGAFTGAIRDKMGRFEMANKGTIFLDEVGELSPAMQVKLLRVLENGTFESVGSEKTIRVDVRVISATNRNLEDLVRLRRFREDLFYRLCGFIIDLPPLRDRLDDVPQLAELFLQDASSRLGQKAVYNQSFLHSLCQFTWPGNVRQLQNCMQYAIIKGRGQPLELKHLPAELVRHRGAGAKVRKPGRPQKLSEELVRDALKEAVGNKAQASKILGVSRATLYRYLKTGRPSG
jgi:PAS domain S-box-containing protein